VTPLSSAFGLLPNMAAMPLIGAAGSTEVTLSGSVAAPSARTGGMEGTVGPSVGEEMTSLVAEVVAPDVAPAVAPAAQTGNQTLANTLAFLTTEKGALIDPPAPSGGPNSAT
jgi:hypothetical protein